MSSLTCAICDSKKAKSCATCEDAAFCAKDCKAEGERIHKLLCAVKEDWGWSTARPDEKSYIAIYFSVDGTGPEFYWSKGRLKAQTNSTTGLVEEIDLLSRNSDKVTSGDIEITHNLATENKLRHPLMFSVRDARGIDGSTVNLSILEMTQGDQRGLWAGPAVLYRWRDHISITDLTYFATFLKTYRDVAGSLKHALRVNDLEDVEKSRPGLFEAVKEMTAARKEARDAANVAAENSEVEPEEPRKMGGKIRLRIVR